MKKYLIIILIVFVCSTLIGCKSNNTDHHMTIEWKYNKSLIPKGGFDSSSDSEPYGKFYKSSKMSYNEFVDYIKQLDNLGYKINPLYSDYTSINNIKNVKNDNKIIELKVCNSDSGDDYLCFIVDWTDDKSIDYTLKVVPNNF